MNGDRQNGQVGSKLRLLPTDADASGRTFGSEELELLRSVIESGTLNCTKGTKVSQLERAFAERHGVSNCVAVSSGTAAIHTAIAGIDPDPGDEIISSPITDMGAIAPIIYQGAIPIFADVDPQTYNVTAETILPRITRHTKAVIVTHLFGNPCDIGPILDLAREYRLKVVEDCSQAFLARYDGQLVGTMGDIGCFSLQQTKHLTSGEGGLIITNDTALARRMRLFHDKGWGYGDEDPDHYFLALNYRMTELQGAVALAQLRRLEEFVANRQKAADQLTQFLQGIPGISPPKTTPGSIPVYWRYAIEANENVIGATVQEFAGILRERYGISAQHNYIKKPAFMCRVLQDKVTFGKSHWPFDSEYRRGEPEVDYDPAHYPGAMRALARVVVLPWNERFLPEHSSYIAEAIAETVELFQGRMPV